MPSSRPDHRPGSRTSRRTASRGGPAGRTRPGARPHATRRSSAAPASAPEPEPGTRLTALTREPSTRPHRSRPTGRMGVLALVVAVLVVSFASSLRAYLVQRSEIQGHKDDIAELEASITDLEREKQRWDDPAFVAAQARSRFGYVKVGETGFQVLDVNGEPLERTSRLHDPEDVIKEEPTAWWTSAWASMEIAGNPPPEKQKEKPADLVDGTKQ